MRHHMKLNLKPVAAIVIGGLCLGLGACSAPPRLTNDDINIESAKTVIEDRLIAPVTPEDLELYSVPRKLPRRTILQVLHAPSSLSDPEFVSLIQEQLSAEIDFNIEQDEIQAQQQEDRSARSGNAEDNQSSASADEANLAEPPAPRGLSDEEKAKIAELREEQRLKLLFDLGLDLEEDLYGVLRDIETNEEQLAEKIIPGLSDAFPNTYGVNLTRDPDGYLSLPANLVFIGGDGSNMPSKTAFLEGLVHNPVISLAVRDMPLRNVIALLAKSLRIQASLSNELLDQDQLVSLNLRASALSILDALLNQNDLALLYDPEAEIARFYLDTELSAQLSNIREAIVGHNKLLFDRKKLQKVQMDKNAILRMIDISQLLLSGDDIGFFAGIDGFPRTGLGEEAITALRDVTDKSFDLRQRLQQFDKGTDNMLNPPAVAPSTLANGDLSGTGTLAGNAQSMRMVSVQTRFADILVEDACIIPGKEVFIEKIAVYNKDPEETKTYVENYFNDMLGVSTTNTASTTAAATSTDSTSATTTASTPVASTAETADSDNASASPTATASTTATATASSSGTALAASPSSNALPTGCTSSPSNAGILVRKDSTGLIVKGSRAQIALATRLIEQEDVPKMQVLVEIFMLTVSRDFTRQIENLITRATDSPGGSGNIEASLLDSISSAVSGGYTVQLEAPSGLIRSALSFIESNSLGRVLSSPTILVQDGTSSATIERSKTAKYTITETEDDNGTISTNEVVQTETAPLTLQLSDVKVQPATNNVTMRVNIKNKQFLKPLSAITQATDAAFNQDTIDTIFTARPGDVIVLAGLTSTEDSSSVRGLPGSTGALAPLAPVLGGSDVIANNVNEMVIFLAPTVIDPSAQRQPHSAFRRR